MTEETKLLQGSITEVTKQLGGEAGLRMAQELGESAPDKIKAIKEALTAAQNDLDQQKISDAQQRLMSVKGQLESLRIPGKTNTDIDNALKALSTITITDAASASQADGVLNATALVAQAEAGEDIQRALGDMLGAVTSGVAAFGTLLGKEVLPGLKTIVNSEATFRMGDGNGGSLNKLVANLIKIDPSRIASQATELPS